MANNDGANFPNRPRRPPTRRNPPAAPQPRRARRTPPARKSPRLAAIAALPKAGEAPRQRRPAGADAGKALYTSTCQACHAAGVLGAPKFGSKEDWAPRLKDSMDTVYNYALHGKGAMPPKGGSNASDADVKAAVDYMVNAAK